MGLLLAETKQNAFAKKRWRISQGWKWNLNGRKIKKYKSKEREKKLQENMDSSTSALSIGAGLSGLNNILF